MWRMLGGGLRSRGRKARLTVGVGGCGRWAGKKKKSVATARYIRTTGTLTTSTPAHMYRSVE